MVINTPGAAMPYILADVVAPLVTTAAANPTVTVDFSTAQLFPFLLGINTTFVFANAIAGETATLVLTQNGTGSMTGTFPATAVFPGGTKTLSTAANATDTVTVKYTGGKYLCTIALAYA